MHVAYVPFVTATRGASKLCIVCGAPKAWSESLVSLARYYADLAGGGAQISVITEGESALYFETMTSRQRLRDLL